MKKVEQTRTKKGTGNCFNACIASIFEIPLEYIPDIMQSNLESDNWFRAYQKWLAQFNIQMIVLLLGDWERVPHTANYDSYYILSGKSPRFDCLHSVVARNNEIVWDPHPQRHMGLGELRDIIFFAPIDPSKPMTLKQSRTNYECESCKEEFLLMSMTEVEDKLFCHDCSFIALAQTTNN